MSSEKDRLYIALYARGGGPKMPGLEDTYHWALIVGPKVESQGGKGTRFDVKERMRFLGGFSQAVWEYEECTIDLQPSDMLLVRVVVGKVKSMHQLRSVFEAVPLRAETPGWNCVGWVKEALEAAQRDGKALGTSVSNWDSIREAAMGYIKKKKDDHRFDGQGQFDLPKAPTWDMIEGKELIP